MLRHVRDGRLGLALLTMYSKSLVLEVLGRTMLLVTC